VNHKQLQELGAQVLSISMDSRFIHKMWEEHELIKMTRAAMPFPMLSDAGGMIGTAYGVYDQASGVDIRGRFIIDPDFVIQAMEVLTPTVGRHLGETIRQLKAFQHVRATGEVTPASWQPGQTALTPGPTLVGKVWEVWQPQLEG
jgi:alkyl hydroperoxide reductase subunit AhpC